MAYDSVSVLRDLAKQSREIANLISDKTAAAGLRRYAEECDAKAAAVEGKAPLPPEIAVPL
jgi:hypothetical protein